MQRLARDNEPAKILEKQSATKVIDVQVYRWVILLITTGSQATVAFISQGVGALAPFLAVGLGLNKAQVGLASGAVNAGMALTFMLAGRMVDLWGERAVLVIGAIFTGISIMLVSTSRSFPVLLSLLIFTGLWAAAATPAGSKAIMSWFPFSKRGFALGIRQTGIPIGGFLAALALPSLALHLSWRMAMVVMGLLAVIGAGICLVTYKEYPHTHVQTPKRLANISCSIGKIILNPNIWFLSLTAITYVSAQFTLITYLIIYLNDQIDLSVGIGGLFLALAQLAGVVGRIFWGIISDTVCHGARKPTLACVGAVAAIMPIAMAFITCKTPLWVVGLVVWFFGFSAIGWNGLYVALVSELVDEDLGGTALGMGLSLVQVGVLVFPPLFGFLVDLSGSYQMSWIALSAFIFIGVLLLSLVHETPKTDEHCRIA